MSFAHKTIKIKIVNPNKGKEQALESTVAMLNSVLSTYLDLTLKHRSLIDRKKESVNLKTGEVRLRPLYNSEILTELEKLSLPTKTHPQTPLNIKSLFPGLPTPQRRSCINTATGMVRSYLSNKKNWESHPSGNPPKPPVARNLPTFYKGTYHLGFVSPREIDSTSSTGDSTVVISRGEPPQIELFDIKNQFVRLKVFDGEQWVWKNYPVKIGRKQLEQLNDPQWSIQSPTLVPKRSKGGIEWYLHLPLAKPVSVKPIEEQKKANPSLTTLAVDLGLRHLAVVTVRQQGKMVFVKFFRGEEVEAHRLRHLIKVFKKQQHSGKPVRGERSNKQLWRHIRETNQAIAHHITREIVSIARRYDVPVLLIESLHTFQPRHGEKRSRKLNRKLTSWLKGKIEEQLRYKAFEHGILVKSVSPYFTSSICNKCGGFGERFSHKSLFRCHGCTREVNADFNASVNLHQVFWGIFPYPKKQKLKACP